MKTILLKVEINEDFIPNHNITYSVGWDEDKQLFVCMKDTNLSGWVSYDEAPNELIYRLLKPMSEFTEEEKEQILAYRGLTLEDGFEVSDIFMEKSFIKLIFPKIEGETFQDQIFQIRESAKVYISDILNIRGTNYELCPPADYEDGLTDSIYELPIASNVSKHGYYDQYALVLARINELGEITFVGVPTTETDDEFTFSIEELSTETIADIADLIKTLEK